MREIFVLILLFAVSSFVPGLGAGPELTPSQLPTGAAKLSEFCPQGWEVESKSSCDLNHDKKDDVVLELLSTVKPAKVPATQYRALVVLFGDSPGHYKLADYAMKLLLCTTCGGQMGATVEIATGNGYFSVNQSGGGGVDGFGYVLTFNYSPSAKQFVVSQAEFTGQSDRVSNVGKTTLLDFTKSLATVTTTGGDKDHVRKTPIKSRQIFLRTLDIDKITQAFKGYPI